VLKFFPAVAVGGVKALNSISPLIHLGVRFMPTGGVNQQNMKEYLEQKTVLAIGGTWLATREDIAAAHWSVIRKNCSIATEVARQVRSGSTCVPIRA
jgi:2-dehydro-3-deoxyphosphogluconate aldolase / (4S)-4-hydroxy-2-oxoglutarate aldolase